MRHTDNDGGQRTATGRRPFLATTAASVAGIGALAGCLGDENGNDDGGTGGAVADADPLGEPVDSSAVTWDDLGDLEGQLTIYSGRTPDQIDPVFAAIDERYDGFELNVDYDENDVQVSQIVQEGDAALADLMYSQDPGALNELNNQGVLQALPQDVIDAVPESYRHPHGDWTGVTGRVRAIQYNSNRWDGDEDDFPTDIMEYATDDRFEGIISTRPNSGTFRGFIQAMVERKGENETREWVRSMVDDQDIQLFSSGGNQAECTREQLLCRTHPQRKSRCPDPDDLHAE